MIVKINGAVEEVNCFTIADLVSKKNLPSARIVVEHNFRILSKDEWTSAALRENDNIEIVSFMGGGEAWKTYLR